jgi:3,4-dihydroxy-9,10-secoandrosta-1,3,5(10)-triene-9,17-dione 4,5-dioxygenase
MPARSIPGENPMAPVSGGRGRRDDGVMFLKADDRQWRIALHRSSTPGVAYAGFELGSQAALAAAVDHLRDCGQQPQDGTPDEVSARGVRELVHIADPNGVRIELYWGPTRDGGFVSPAGVPSFVTGELGLGHYVLMVPDMAASLDFYQQVLGLKLSDYILLGPDMSVQFLRCSPRHHSVALTAVGPITALHHIALEMTDIDQVGYALDRATRAGHAITASLGRHKNDRMLSFYMRSPAGFEVEIGCGGRLVDDATWVVNHFTAGDEWGHHGLMVDAMTANK